MKLAIVGGGGIRVPLLVNGLVGRGLPITEVALFDVDQSRQSTMARLTRLRAPDIPITLHDEVTACVRDAAFVVTSIRAGSLAARQHDEAVALRHGLVGQETVGPAGFAMGMRTIPELAAYAEQIARHAPAAWVINFSNPVGMITQAMHLAGARRTIGICDTPTELFAEIAHALAVPVHECAFDYVGLNHLGWVREVHHRGQPLLAPLWGEAARLASIYQRPMFPPAHLARLRLLPTEYVFYYDFPDRAVANMRAAGTSRGAVVSAMTARLLQQIDAGTSDPIRVYEDYLAARSASYMQIESGQTAPAPPSPWAELTGYDRIAFDVIHAIVHGTNAVIPLDVRNDGNLPELDGSDVIEVPCVVGVNGPRPLHAGPLPAPVRALVVRVKEYERRTIAAASSRRRSDMVDALAHNPLVPDTTTAEALIEELTL